MTSFRISGSWCMLWKSRSGKLKSQSADRRGASKQPTIGSPISGLSQTRAALQSQTALSAYLWLPIGFARQSAQASVCSEVVQPKFKIRNHEQNMAVIKKANSSPHESVKTVWKPHTGHFRAKSVSGRWCGNVCSRQSSARHVIGALKVYGQSFWSRRRQNSIRSAPSVCHWIIIDMIPLYTCIRTRYGFRYYV